MTNFKKKISPPQGYIFNFFKLNPYAVKTAQMTNYKKLSFTKYSQIFVSLPTTA